MIKFPHNITNGVNNIGSVHPPGGNKRRQPTPTRSAVNASLTSNKTSAALDAATRSIAQDLSAGKLVAVCPDWQGEAVTLYLLCADQRQLNLAIRALHQTLPMNCLQALVQVSSAT